VTGWIEFLRRPVRISVSRKEDLVVTLTFLLWEQERHYPHLRPETSWVAIGVLRNLLPQGLKGYLGPKQKPLIPEARFINFRFYGTF